MNRLCIYNRKYIYIKLIFLYEAFSFEVFNYAVLHEISNI